MANTVSSPNLNEFTTSPGVKDLLDLFERHVLLNLNCVHIGTIQSFNATQQTANITVNYQKTFKTKNAQGVYSSEQVNYPILVDCPVVCLGGKKAALTFPISTGDECLVFFNDRDIDNWFASGQVTPVATGRLHSFSDGIALVGIRSFPHVLTGYDTARAVLKNGTAKVAVSETKINVSNATTDLKTILSDFESAVNTFMTTLSGFSGGGAPVTQAMLQAPAATAITSLSAVLTKIGALLE